MAILEAGFDDATAVLALPEPYRRRLTRSRQRHGLIVHIPNMKVNILLILGLAGGIGYLLYR